MRTVYMWSYDQSLPLINLKEYEALPDVSVYAGSLSIDTQCYISASMCYQK